MMELARMLVFKRKARAEEVKRMLKELASKERTARDRERREEQRFVSIRWCLEDMVSRSVGYHHQEPSIRMTLYEYSEEGMISILSISSFGAKEE
jgi:hypothetical protein